MDLLCMACTPATKWTTDAELKDHLVTFHNTTSMDEAVQSERLKRKNTPANVPVVDLPPGIPPQAAPTDDFVQMMQQIEKDKLSKPTPPIPVAPPPTITVEPKPIILGYKYSGDCPKCKNEVKTLELDTDNKHFAVAYCLFCNTQIQSQEVAKLNVIPKVKLISTYKETIKTPDVLIEEFLPVAKKDVVKKKKGKNGGSNT